LEKYITFLLNAKFLMLLVQMDREIAEHFRRQKRCQYCGGALHLACYFRKVRLPGVIAMSIPDLGFSFSFCCSNRVCRRRHRPPSLRFAGSSPNMLALVALVDLLNAPGSELKLQKASGLLGLSLRTLKRWLKFWRRSKSCSWWRRLVVKFPVLRFPHDLLPESLGGLSSLVWLYRLSGIFGELSKYMACFNHPHKLPAEGN
jgi:hypothetical protein